ncbi:glycoside hydrolase family 20 zincin-like fold domain-containing protein [Nonomuraea sediminis]|uniref:glycoside hydrolase family 20 zincin-like fold domain-containing protein n=1 Tax=Nonomuraea sediminis TaxID=2835864 RepID=UPI001BDD6FDE|nr:glycoside hydrolase family 20 zincin-like fold domain-containing protein [Nonomuraea sediminis]
MRLPPRLIAALLTLLLSLASPIVLPAGPARADARPLTVPALREWTAATGSFGYGSASRIVLDPATAWGTTGQTVADDLAALTGTRPAVVSGTRPAAQPGDIHLALGATDTALGEEGYRLESGPVLSISARTIAGAFNGTRSVLQLLRQSRTVAAGVARDWPTSPQRGVWLDTTARHFDPAWWHNLIRDISYLKLNELGIQMYGDGRPTDAELSDLLAIADRYHVNVTPQRQVAGHADLDILKGHPEYAVGTSGLPAGAFDFTKPGALAIAQQAIEETIAKFPGKYFHAGGDEVLAYPATGLNWDDYPQFAAFARTKTGNPAATGGDAFDWYFNWINGIVKSHGKSLVMWNDFLQPDGVLGIDRDIMIDYWDHPTGHTGFTAQELADAGHKISNLDAGVLYYNVGGSRPDARRIYENFDVTAFNGGTVTGAAVSSVLGARIAVWTWAPPGAPAESNQEIIGRLYEPVRSLAQIDWGTPKLYPAFADFNALVHRLGRAPGYLVTPATHGSGPGIGAGFEMNGELSVVQRTPAGTVRHGWQKVPGGGPWEFETFPNWVLHDVSSDPVLARYPGGVKTLVARRSDGMLLQATQYVGNAGPWLYRELGVSATGRPAILVGADGRLALAARQADGRLLVGRESSERGTWTFGNAGTGVAGDPSMALDHAGKIAIAARSTSGQLVLLRERPDLGFDATTIGQAGIAGTPALAVNLHGELVYFARTGGGQVQYGREQAPGQWLYQNVGPGGLAGDPAAEVDVNGKLIYFARTANGHLQHGWESTPGSRTVFTIEDLGSGITGEISTSNDVSGRLTYFAADSTGRIRHGYQKVPGGGPWGTCHLELDC